MILDIIVVLCVLSIIACVVKAYQISQMDPMDRDEAIYGEPDRF